MPAILVKDVPAEVHARLQARARAHRRSMSREALVLLERVLDDRSGPPSLAELDAARVHGQLPLTDDVLERARQVERP